MSALAGSLAFRLFHGLRPGDDLLVRMREAERYQWLDRREQRERQLRQLRDLLHHIRQHVPYYADVLPATLPGLTGDGRVDWGDVPLLDKPTIRAAGTRIRSAHPADRGLPNATSGSTGESLRFELDDASRSVRAATTHRFHGWAGIGPHDRQAKLWGARFDTPKGGLRNGLIQALHPSLFLSSYEMSDSLMEKYVRELTAFRPRMLVSYPTPLEHFARFCETREVRLPSLRAIVCSAEQLQTQQRELAQRVLAAPVFDRYGSREFANVAQECPEHAGLHVATDHVYLELIRSDGLPATGSEVSEVVVTDLHNRAMPFVRYRTGDLARWVEEPCPCGRTLPRLSALEGRVFELIRAPGGEVISGTFWPQVVKQASQRVRLYQVVQEDPASIEVRLVMDPAGELEPEEAENLLARIRQHAPSLGVRISYVADVPLTPGGKRRTVIGLPADR